MGNQDIKEKNRSNGEKEAFVGREKEEAGTATASPGKTRGIIC